MKKPFANKKRRRRRYKEEHGTSKEERRSRREETNKVISLLAPSFRPPLPTLVTRTRKEKKVRKQLKPQENHPWRS
jgi:hypothetical protein